MRKVLVRLLLPLLAVGLLSPVASHAEETATVLAPRTPALPAVLLDELRDNRLVLLDFYSQYCGVCLKMESHLRELEKSVRDKVHFLRIDVGDENNKHYMDLYNITGTPTYILFDAEGKPLYKMEERISSLLLRLQLLRRTNQLPKVALSDKIKALQDAQATGKTILVSFQNDACKPCSKADVYLNVFENASSDALKVVRLDPDEANARDLAKELSVNPVQPFYLIMDTSGQELFRHQGVVEPKVLWDIIQTFTVSGV